MMRERLTSRPGVAALYSVLLFIIGLAYRSTFLSQGFNGTDEGWLQTLGQRVANGQVPYRDFYFVLPPVSLYREAALIKLFGDTYGILAARWAFAVEATLASIVAFIILRRFVSDHLAFFSCLPTIFFSVIFYYFSNYTYDAVFFALIAVAFLTYGVRGAKWFSTAAGVAAALAFLAKPTFLAFLVLLPLGSFIAYRLANRPAESGPWWREPTDWRYFFLGYGATCGIVFGYLGVAGALGQFVYQAFLLTRQAFPTSLSFLLFQDMPDRLLSWPAAPALFGIVVLLLLRGNVVIDAVRLPLLALALAYFVIRVLQAPGSGPPTGRQELLVVIALGVLLLLNILAFAASVRWKVLPPELPFFAFMLQYVTQINYSGLRYSYMGTYLSLPIAIVFVRAWLARTHLDQSRFRAWIPNVVGALLAVWLIMGAAVVTRGTVYRDASRAQLTAAFRTPKLAGITSLPSNVARIDGLTDVIQTHSRRGDPILVFPDLSVLYFLTDRRDPTMVDWYDPSEIIPSMTQASVTELERDPARVVLLQTYDEADFLRAGAPLDYAASAKWEPLYRFIHTHYRHVSDVGDVGVYIPQTNP